MAFNCVLMAIILFQQFFHSKERKELVEKIMAKSFHEWSNYSLSKEPKVKKEKPDRQRL